MWPRTKTRRTWDGPSGLIWIVAALGCGVAMLFYVGYVVRDFDLRGAEGAAAPMKVVARVVLAGILSLCFGGTCAVIGAMLSYRGRRWVLALCALGALAVACAPMLAGIRGVHRVTVEGRR